MADDPIDPESLEKEKLVWRTRELLLRSKVLQAQLSTAQRTMADTLELSKLSKTLGNASPEDDRHHRINSKQEKLHEERRLRLKVLQEQLGNTKSQINERRKQMIQELWDIYPIIEFPDRKGYSICDIHLPNADNFEGHDETMVSVAIGYVGHLVLLLSEILDISLRFPLRYYGSKSLIHCNRRNQLFPLYVDSFKSRECINFSYGMSLLNLDIVQMRTLYGLPTNDPVETLGNIRGLKIALDNDD